jgi:gamma-glutamyltranspeptidase
LEIQQNDFPRFPRARAARAGSRQKSRSGRYAIGEARDTLHIEGRLPAATIVEPKRRGHLVNQWPDRHEYAGHAHGITIDPGSGLLIGGSDPRSDGAAIGY